jgi:hypothetical protein
MSPEVSISEHASTRMKERLGIPKSAHQRTAQRAFDQGVKHSETFGNLCRYLDKQYLSHSQANNMRVHGHHIFVFADTVLITVLHLPQNLVRDLKKCQPA